MKALNLLFSPSSKTQPIGIINADWLSFSVTLLENSTERDQHEYIFHTPDGYKLVELQGTNIYRRRLILYERTGRKTLTLLCEPYSRMIDRSAALVEVANEYLYTGYGFMLELANKIHPCTFLCLSRFDVCCDFVGIPERINVIQALSTNQAYIAGKRDGSQFHSYTSERSGVERVPRCLSWGSKNSNIKWKVYNKTAEIFEYNPDGSRVCHKPYIVDQWQRCGWDDNNVWRCEVSVSPAAKFKFYDKRLGWRFAVNGFDIQDFFCSMYMTRFVIRRNQGHKDKTNDERIHLLYDMGQVQRVTRWQNENPKDTPVVEYASCLNAAMLQLSKPEVVINEEMRQVWINTAKECIRLGNLGQYFVNKYKCNPMYIDDICNEEVLFSPSSKTQP